MGISRRALLGLAFGGVFAGSLRPAQAARFSDASGLTKGQFIWQPSLAPEGAVLIVVTARQQIVHVYRGGRLIGIAGLKAVAPAARRLAGAFNLSDQRHERDGSGAARLVWRADRVHLEPTGVFEPQEALALLPDDFASLLFRITENGAVVVLAEDRGDVVSVTTSGMPLLRGDAAESAGADLLQRARRLGETADPMGHEAAIVISLRDRVARLVRGGATEASAAIEVANGGRLSGSYVFTLTGEERGGLGWLSAPVSRTPSASHLDAAGLAGVLATISFADEREGLALVHELGRGALLQVTDRPLEKLRRTPGGFELLANRPPLPPAPEAVATAHTPTRTAKVRARPAIRTVEVPEPSGASQLARQLFQGAR